VSDQPSPNPEPDLPNPTATPSQPIKPSSPAPKSKTASNLPYQNLPASATKEPPSLLSNIFAFIFRLIVLGVGMSIAAVVGITLAIAKPDWVVQPHLSRLFQQEDQKFTLATDALFAIDHAEIREESYQILDQVAAELPLEPGKKISILGHTDNDGETTGSDSLELSYQQALAVRNYLSRLRGEETYYWIAIGYGSSQPVEVNDTVENRSKNRRIEIIVSDP
jgi:outer membrane protein OmpA-like peptidoglycan-associated protein